ERTEETELEHPERPRERRIGCELREAATIAGKNLRVRIAARGEPEQKLAHVVRREQPLPAQLVDVARGLHVREPAELTAPDPRQLERHERLQQRTARMRGASRSARNETHAAVPR